MAAELATMAAELATMMTELVTMAAELAMMAHATSSIKQEDLDDQMLQQTTAKNSCNRKNCLAGQVGTG